MSVPSAVSPTATAMMVTLPVGAAGGGAGILGTLGNPAGLSLAPAQLTDSPSANDATAAAAAAALSPTARPSPSAATDLKTAGKKVVKFDLKSANNAQNGSETLTFTVDIRKQLKVEFDTLKGILAKFTNPKTGFKQAQRIALQDNLKTLLQYPGFAEGVLQKLADMQTLLKKTIEPKTEEAYKLADIRNELNKIADKDLFRPFPTPTGSGVAAADEAASAASPGAMVPANGDTKVELSFPCHIDRKRERESITSILDSIKAALMNAKPDRSALAHLGVTIEKLNPEKLLLPPELRMNLIILKNKLFSITEYEYLQFSKVILIQIEHLKKNLASSFSIEGSSEDFLRNLVIDLFSFSDDIFEPSSSELHIMLMKLKQGLMLFLRKNIAIVIVEENFADRTNPKHAKLRFAQQMIDHCDDLAEVFQIEIGRSTPLEFNLKNYRLINRIRRIIFYFNELIDIPKLLNTTQLSELLEKRNNRLNEQYKTVIKILEVIDIERNIDNLKQFIEILAPMNQNFSDNVLEIALEHLEKNEIEAAHTKLIKGLRGFKRVDVDDNGKTKVFEHDGFKKVLENSSDALRWKSQIYLPLVDELESILKNPDDPNLLKGKGDLLYLINDNLLPIDEIFKPFLMPALKLMQKNSIKEAKTALLKILPKLRKKIEVDEIDFVALAAKAKSELKLDNKKEQGGDVKADAAPPPTPSKRAEKPAIQPLAAIPENQPAAAAASPSKAEANPRQRGPSRSAADLVPRAMTPDLIQKIRLAEELDRQTNAARMTEDATPKKASASAPNAAPQPDGGLQAIPEESPAVPPAADKPNGNGNAVNGTHDNVKTDPAAPPQPPQPKVDSTTSTTNNNFSRGTMAAVAITIVGLVWMFLTPAKSASDDWAPPPGSFF